MAAEKVEQGKRTIAELVRAYKDKLLLIVFYARWCKPCTKLLNLELPTVAQEATDETAICPVDVQESGNYYDSRKFKAEKVPVTLFFRRGEEVSRISGLAKAQTILSRIKGYTQKFETE